MDTEQLTTGELRREHRRGRGGPGLDEGDSSQKKQSSSKNWCGHQEDWVVMAGACQAEGTIKKCLLNCLFPMLAFSVFGSFAAMEKKMQDLASEFPVTSVPPPSSVT